MATLSQTLYKADEGGVNVKLDNENQTYYVMTLIKRLLPYLPLWEDAQKVTIPHNADGFNSNSINLRKFAALTVSTTALSEGVVPDGLDLTVSTVTTALAQYGEWIKITDVLATAAIDDVIRESMDLLAENAGQVLHKVIINALSGADNTNQFWAGSATADNQLAATDVMTSTIVKKAVRELRANNCMPFPDGFYHGVLHPYQAYDLMNDSLWQDVARYNGGAASGGGMSLLAGEIGKIHGVRFRESTDVKVAADGAASANVYDALVYGPNAFGVFDFKSQAVNNINATTNRGISVHAVPVNTPTKDDPLGQFGIVGWKAAFAAKIIDADRICLLSTGATQ